MNGSPFKQAWYHDFAPPINSLDRHGDFAPPLLALELAAGFFAVASPGTGGDGLQYHSGTYGADNEGDWFFAAANDTSAGPGAPSIGYVDQAGNIYTSGFSWQFDTGNSGAPVAVTNDGGFLVDTDGNVQIDGGSGVDIQSGDDMTLRAVSFIDWYSDGGTINADPGGFGINAGGITLTSVDGGSIALNADTAISLDATTGILLSAGTDIQIQPTTTAGVNLPNGGTFVVKDHLGSPLVTYTG